MLASLCSVSQLGKLNRNDGRFNKHKHLKWTWPKHPIYIIVIMISLVVVWKVCS